MAVLTGLFKRGNSYYLRVVLPLKHPLQSKYKNGEFVISLGRCTKREAVLSGSAKRLAVLMQHETERIVSWASSAVTPPEIQETHLLRQVHTRWTQSKTRSTDSVSTCLRAVKLFEEFTGNTPITQLTREQGDGFRSWLIHSDRQTTPKTARDRMIWVKSLLQYAAKDLGLIPRNPWHGIDINFKTTNKRRPWTTQELTTFFDQPLHNEYKLPTNKLAGADAAYWIPLLGMYTGARVGELAQLRVSDIDDSQDTPMMHICDDGEEQTVKTKAGIRQFPLHSQLIRLGFLDYVSSVKRNGDEKLWPLLPVRPNKPGGYFSNWFGIYRRSLGLKQFPDFHCFRHTVRSQMAEAGVPEQVIDTIVGHEVSGSTGAKVYTHRTKKTLQDAIEVLQYPTLLAPRIFTAKVSQQ